MPKTRKASTKLNRYRAIIARIFEDRYQPGMKEPLFVRDNIIETATSLGIKLPKNLGDVIYAMKFRMPLPDEIIETQPKDRFWIIDEAGRSKYAFRLVRMAHILPNKALDMIAIPDSTPELISKYARTEEQALLAILRYNRLLDIFLGVATYSLQSHLRSTISSGSQIEIDELYVGVDKIGCHYVIPIQAKGSTDKSHVVQTKQDIVWCQENFPGIRCRAVTAQFLGDSEVALFDLVLKDGEVRLSEERHYKMVLSEELDEIAIRNYRD
jgi:hypothetical protein